MVLNRKTSKQAKTLNESIQRNQSGGKYTLYMQRIKIKICRLSKLVQINFEKFSDFSADIGPIGPIFSHEFQDVGYL